MSYASKTPNSLLYLIGKSKITNIANERRNGKKGDKECGIREERRHRIEG